jgi:dienelactone hydrolase
MITMNARSWRSRVPATVLALGLLAGGVAAIPAAAASAQPKAHAARVVPIGRYAVGQISATFVDHSRPTNANGSFPGAPYRTLLTAIYYPATGAPTHQLTVKAPFDTTHGPYPLILFGHGDGGRGVGYEAVLKQWASAGYVVAAPDYPLSNRNAPGGWDFVRGAVDVKNQPADASFVISQVLKLDKSKKLVGGTIDPKHIGAAGHSLGAITTYGLVYSACCRDMRIAAAIPVSGSQGLGPADSPTNYFQGVNTPLLSLHGNADPLQPYQNDLDGWAKANPPKFFLTFLGAGHLLFSLQPPCAAGPCPTGVQAIALQKATVDFWDRYLKGDTAALGHLRTDASVPGATTFQENAGTPNSPPP